MTFKGLGYIMGIVFECRCI